MGGSVALLPASTMKVYVTLNLNLNVGASLLSMYRVIPQPADLHNTTIPAVVTDYKPVTSHEHDV